MKDGFLRRSVKRATLVLYFANLYGTRAIWRLQGKKPYKLGGACQKCAQCCESPAVQVGFFTWYFSFLRRPFLWWQKHVNGFELVDRDIQQRVFIFRCTHFDWETRRCDSYSSRPGMCRDYPRNLLWQPSPQFLEGCGYRPVHCNAAKFIDNLREEGIEGEKLEELKEKLHLRE